MKRIINISCLLILTVIFAGNLVAQEKSASDKTVLKLQQKVLLSDEQAAKVKTILNTYLAGDRSQESLAEAQKNIESVFDEKQKAKYDIIKDDWWKSVNKISKE